MIPLTPEQQAALSKPHIARRQFIYCDALDPDGVTPAPAGFWDDLGRVHVAVDGVSRLYHGSGNVIRIAPLSAVGDLSIPGLQITLSGLAPETAALVRGSTVGQRAVDLRVGLFDTESRELIGDLIPRFIGRVDDIKIETPAAGGDSTVVLSCESIARALTIRRYETRSDASQRLRDPDDAFYTYTALQREKPIYFGRKGPR